ncbi:MAG: ACT domain-containing protein [Candidatus Acidiferrales bacterium]
MPTNREFAVTMEDRPGALGKVCKALGDRGVNILAFQSFPVEGKSLVRFVFDNPTAAKPVLDAERLKFTEAEVAQVRLSHRPGELARVASRLGESDVNINYAYCGVEADTNTPMIVFGVNNVAKAAPILDKEAAATARTS